MCNHIVRVSMADTATVIMGVVHMDSLTASFANLLAVWQPLMHRFHAHLEQLDPRLRYHLPKATVSPADFLDISGCFPASTHGLPHINVTRLILTMHRPQQSE
jgi:hypothetical protein